MATRHYVKQFPITQAVCREDNYGDHAAELGINAWLAGEGKGSRVVSAVPLPITKIGGIDYQLLVVFDTEVV